jgi:ketosteroid isomerase-like protein
MNIQVSVLARRFRLHVLFLITVAIFCRSTFAQPPQPDARKTDASSVKAEVEKAIREYHEALARFDIGPVLSYTADDGMFYDSTGGYSTGSQQKAVLKNNFQLIKPGAKDSFELTDLKITVIGPDAAAANYRLVDNFTEDGKEESFRSAMTQVLVRRDGKWQILAEHASRFLPPVEPTAPGMPVGWTRTLSGSANSYVFSVDTVVKHSDKASASIKFACGDEQDNIGYLQQIISAAEYRGKRLRLTGWIKTADAKGAGLWLSVDSDRRLLGFDNMWNRPVRGDTDWKQYSVVLDVPVEAVNIRFGAILSGKGQLWADDLSFDVVDTKTSLTNVLSPEELAQDNERVKKRKPATITKPVNLGFEDGTIH